MFQAPQDSLPADENPAEQYSSDEKRTLCGIPRPYTRELQVTMPSLAYTQVTTMHPIAIGANLGDSASLFAD